MRKYDVVVKTARGMLTATMEAPETVPTGLLLQAVMSHQQLLPHLVELDANAAETLLVSTPNRLDIKSGFTIVFHDGVSINGPMEGSAVANVPRQFHGVQLVYNMAAQVNYLVELRALSPADDTTDETNDFDKEYSN